MSKYVGKHAVVIQKDSLTYGKTCEIQSWDPQSRKYKVDFDDPPGWCGWYTLKELRIIEETEDPQEETVRCRRRRSRSRVAS